MSEIVILARIIADAEDAEPVRLAIEELAAASRQEAGNIIYDVFISGAEKPEFLCHEVWSDSAAFEAHKHMPHMSRFKEQVTQSTRITVEKLAKL